MLWHRWEVARGYSRDLRERLLQALASGLSAAEIARITGVSPSSLRRWKRKRAAGGSLDPGASPGGPRKITTFDEPALRTQVAATPDATLAEHCTQWAADGHVPVSISTMSRALDRLGLPLKTRP
jgi:transposase